MNIKIYNKLVRDKIPQIIEGSGRKAVVEEVSDEQYIKLLNEKLGEELKEYLEDQSIEELADLVEVVHAILQYKKVSIEDFEAVRLHKVNERGAFRDRLLLKEVIED